MVRDDGVNTGFIPKYKSVGSYAQLSVTARLTNLGLSGNMSAPHPPTPLPLVMKLTVAHPPMTPRGLLA